MNGDLSNQIFDDELQESLAHYSNILRTLSFSKIMYLKKAQECFKNLAFTLIQWPAQSPDPNRIENLRECIKRMLGEYEMLPSGMLEL